MVGSCRRYRSRTYFIDVISERGVGSLRGSGLKDEIGVIDVLDIAWPIGSGPDSGTRVSLSSTSSMKVDSGRSDSTGSSTGCFVDS